MSVAIALVGVDQASKPIQTVTRSLEGMEEQGKKTGGVFDGLTSVLGKVGLAGLGIQTAIGAVSGAVGLLTGPIQAASDLNESLSKVQVVFGDSAKSVEAFAKTAAQNLGQSQAQALEAAGTFGNLFVSMGLGQGQAAKLSTEIVTLGSDLASFNNIKPEEALEKLRAGLVGEAEPLRALGVNINEAAVEDEALRLGLAKTKKEITDAAKIQARYSLILTQTKTAQGDFSRTSTGMANATRIISASLADLQVEIGNRLLPVVAPLVSSIAQQLPRAMDALAPLLDRVGVAVGRAAAGFGQLVSLGSTVVGFFTRAQGAGLALHNTLETLIGAGAAGVVIRGFEGVRAAVESLGKTASAVFGRLMSGDVKGALAALVGGLGDVRARIVETVAGWGAAFVSWITPLLPKLAAQVLTIADTVVGLILTQTPVLAKQFAGWVDAFVAWAIEAAPPLLKALGEVGEMVVRWVIDTAPVLIDTLLGEWLPAALVWVLDLAKKIGPELGKVFVAVVDWIGDNAPELLQTFISEWVPAAIVWVAKAAILLIPELVKMAFAIQNWITTTGVPKLIELGGKLGNALIDGIVKGAKTLYAELGPVLVAELQKIKIDLGPFHLSAGGFTIDAPQMPALPGLGGGTQAPATGGGSVPAMQHGGLFRVGGSGGVDSRMVAFRATPGEVVAVGHPRAGGGGGSVTVNFSMGAVHVHNEADEDRLVAKIERVLTDGLGSSRRAGVRFPLGVSAPASG